ncbi:phosphoglycolate phosphatase [Tahibacter amnicola]|uniref:phosphoglycolate phosphatase n=1 Tax=Tahibacter amnicola TaxID=2976241 RepID=A0ABY6BK97_9GAMM|nr:phosphoglycolate phosphatase [Tahibacter amnicola]UXI70036.1 phosphoglycolate phosphatase [Tahibacter amnicola]
MKLFGRDLDAVLFDLDGTLVDSAPDLIHAIQRLCVALEQPAADAEAVRAVVSKGGRAMLQKGLPHYDPDQREALLERFLAMYAENIAEHSRPYAGVESLLRAIEQRGARWGIVTNKPGWLARPLVQQLGWSARAASLVSGDCLPVKKPDPAPVLHACELAGVRPERCAYVGDDLRDIEAGRSAGMLTVAAAWGYLNGEDPATWAADLVSRSADELTRALSLAAA